MLDQHMSWETHINQLRTKIRHLAGKFYGLREILDQRTAKTLYCALVESLLNYGITVWGNASPYLMTRIERAQNCAVSNISTTSRADDEDYKNLEILRASELHIFRVISRNYFQPRFRKRREVEHNVRCGRVYTENKTINKYGERVRAVKVPKLLNSLPENVRNIESISRMKSELRQWINATKLK